MYTFSFPVVAVVTHCGLESSYFREWGLVTIFKQFTIQCLWSLLRLTKCHLGLLAASTSQGFDCNQCYLLGNSVEI